MLQLIHPKQGSMGYIKHECSNHIQHEGEARGLYVVMQESRLPFLGCINWFVSYKPLIVPQGNIMIFP